jgi:hypothetical protein
MKKKIKPCSLIKEVLKHGPNASKTRISHYVFQKGDGSISLNFSDVCYARFTSYDSGIKKARVYLNQGPHYFKTRKTLKQYKDFVHWVVNESLWKKAFLNGKSNYYKYGLAINTNMPPTFIVAALTAIREPLEHAHTAPTFFALRKQGISPELSHIVCGITRGNVLGGRNSGHDLFCEPTLSTLTSYKQGATQYKRSSPKPMNKAANSFYGIQDIFPSRDKATYILELLKPFCVNKKERNEWAAVPHVDLTKPELIAKLKEIDDAN